MTKPKTKYRVKTNKDFASKLITSATMIALGVLMCIFKSDVIKWFMIILGVMLLVKGVLDFISGRVIGGGIFIVMGIVTLVFGFMAVKIALIVLGVVLALFGVSGLMGGGCKNIIRLIYCIILLVGGVMLACNADAAIQGIFVAVGVILIVDGILMLFGEKVK